MIKSTIFLSYDEIKNLEKGNKIDIELYQEDTEGKVCIKKEKIKLEIVYNDEIVA